jgi:hypothetical protein
MHRDIIAVFPIAIARLDSSYCGVVPQPVGWGEGNSEENTNKIDGFLDIRVSTGGIGYEKGNGYRIDVNRC